MSESNKIHNGTDPKKLLKKRGGEFDGQGLFPQVPDFLGYILGFMLIWLVYTGLGAVSGVLTQSKQKVVAMKKEVTSEAKLTVEKIKREADRIDQQEMVRARLNSEVKVEKEKGSWTARQLKKANIFIDVLADEAGSMLAEVLVDSDYAEIPQDTEELVIEAPSAPDYSLDRF